MNKPLLVTLAGSVFYAAGADAAELIQSFQVRLLTPITSYRAADAPFRARVVGPARRGDAPGIPPGTIIHGIVHTVKSVGLGLRRERARLDLDFERCELPDGNSFPCKAQLLQVDNAREDVVANNRVRGILAASHANSWFSGVWYRPTGGFLHRSAAGLTGASGVINTRYAPGPAGAAIVITSRLLLFRMPDPEIDFPAGTDLIVRLHAEAALEDGNSGQQQMDSLPDEIAGWLSIQPAAIKQADGSPVADLINVALVGSREQVESAFEAAGWTRADALTPKTFARTYQAYTSMRAYPTSPVSPLYYLERAPDLVMQRGLNSVAKRHHIRLWAANLGGAQLWLGAATHDVGIAFDWKRMAPTHRIDPEIDLERSKILNDLSDTPCADVAESVLRPRLSNQERSAGRRSITDGSLAVVLLRECPSPQPDSVHPKPRRSRSALIFRRVVLETRHYWTRSNLYYWTQRGARWTFSSLKSRMER